MQQCRSLAEAALVPVLNQLVGEEEDEAVVPIAIATPHPHGGGAAAAAAAAAAAVVVAATAAASHAPTVTTTSAVTGGGRAGGGGWSPRVRTGGIPLKPGQAVRTVRESYTPVPSGSRWAAASRRARVERVHDRPVVFVELPRPAGGSGAAAAGGGSDGGEVVVIPTDVTGAYYLPAANPFAGGGPSGMSPFAALADTPPPVIGSHLGTGMVAEVEHEGGVKRVTLRSTVCVTNQIALPLLLQFEDSAGTGVITRLRLMPGESTYIPLAAAAGGSLRVAPYVPAFMFGAAAGAGGGGGVAYDVLDASLPTGAPLPSLTPFALSAPLDIAALQAPYVATAGVAPPGAPRGGGEGAGGPTGAATRLANFFSIYTATQKAALERDTLDAAERLAGKAVVLRCEPVMSAGSSGSGGGGGGGGAAAAASGAGDLAVAAGAALPLLAFQCCAHIVRPQLPRRSAADAAGAVADILGAPLEAARAHSARADLFTTRIAFLPCLRIENLLPYPLVAVAYHPAIGAGSTAAAGQAWQAGALVRSLALPAPPPPPEVAAAAGFTTLAAQLRPGAMQDVLFFAPEAVPGQNMARWDTANVALSAAFAGGAARRTPYTALGWSSGSAPALVYGPGSPATSLTFPPPPPPPTAGAGGGGVAGQTASLPLHVYLERASVAAAGSAGAAAGAVAASGGSSGAGGAQWTAAALVDRDLLALKLAAVNAALLAAAAVARLYVPYWFVNRADLPLRVMHAKLRASVAGSAPLPVSLPPVIATGGGGGDSSSAVGVNDVVMAVRRDSYASSVGSGAHVGGSAYGGDIQLYAPPPADAHLPAITVALSGWGAGMETSQPVAINSVGLRTITTVPLDVGAAGGEWPNVTYSAVTAVSAAAPPVTNLHMPPDDDVLAPLYPGGGPGTPGGGGLRMDTTVVAAGRRAPGERAALQLGLAIEAAPGRFFRSKVVAVAPQFVLLNKSGYPVEYPPRPSACCGARPGRRWSTCPTLRRRRRARSAMLRLTARQTTRSRHGRGGRRCTGRPPAASTHCRCVCWARQRQVAAAQTAHAASGSGVVAWSRWRATLQ